MRPVHVSDKLGPYQITAKLGAGLMGEAFRAKDRRSNREVAVKVLPRAFADADRLRRFEQEAKTLAALNHPNVLTIYDAGGLGFGLQSQTGTISSVGSKPVASPSSAVAQGWQTIVPRFIVGLDTRTDKDPQGRNTIVWMEAIVNVALSPLRGVALNRIRSVERLGGRRCPPDASP